MKLKVCGMRARQNIIDLLVLEPDYMGFIFYEQSPRNASNILNMELLRSFPACTKKVGVFVNEEINKVAETVMKFELDVVQLHGDETVEYVLKLKEKGLSIIKAFSIDKKFDFDQVPYYEPYVDYFLFDTKGEVRGGTGKKFDWGLLKNYNRNVPYFLSGGIDLANLTDLEVLSGKNLHAIDVNSKFETQAGLKNIEKLKRLKSEI